MGGLSLPSSEACLGKIMIKAARWISSANLWDSCHARAYELGGVLGGLQLEMRLLCSKIHPLCYVRMLQTMSDYALGVSILCLCSKLLELYCQNCIAAGCRKTLVNARWAIILLSCTNGPRKHSFRLVGVPFMTFQESFSPEECSLVGLNTR